MGQPSRLSWRLDVYGSGVVFTLGYVPLGEYAISVLQLLLVGLWFYRLDPDIRSDVASAPSERASGSCSRPGATGVCNCPRSLYRVFLVTDTIAIHFGVWTITEKIALGLTIGNLPIEELLFFLLTNLLLVHSVLIHWTNARIQTSEDERPP